ncbi:hypothetical protein Tco_1215708 [Tanacetum coccineum]
MQIMDTSNGLKTSSQTPCGVKCRLSMTNMHYGASLTEGENVNNSMDLLLYTSRLLDAACKKVLNLLKKGLLVYGEAKTTLTPTSPTTQAQVTYVSEPVSYSKFGAKTFVDPHGFEGNLKMEVYLIPADSQDS